MTKPSKNPAYFSFNKTELFLLSECSHAHLALYVHLKTQSCFKTGLVGRFGVCLTLQQMADAICRPSSQGKASIQFDPKAMSRMLEEMEKKTLIAWRENATGDAVMYLYWSLHHFEKGLSWKDGADPSNIHREDEPRLPKEFEPNEAETRAPLTFAEVSTSVPNTDSTAEKSAKHKNTSSYRIFEEPPEGMRAGTKAGFGPQGAVPPSTPPWSGRRTAGARAPLSAKAQLFRDALNSNGRFSPVDGKLSWSNYEDWSKKGLLPYLDEAIIEMVLAHPDDLLTPIDFAPFLYGVRNRINIAGARKASASNRLGKYYAGGVIT